MKEAVLPFARFPDVDTVLGPEMRSTGEVMGIDRSFGLAFTKSQISAGNRLPAAGTVLFSLADRDKPAGIVAARRFAELGFTLVATAGTATALEAEGLRVESVIGKLTGASAGDGHRRRTSTRSSCSRRGRSTWSSTRRGVGGPGPTATTSAARPPPAASPASPRSRLRLPPPPGSGSGPPRRPTPGRSRSTTVTASSGSTCEPGAFR